MNEPETYETEPLICMTSLNILQKFSPPLSFAILFLLFLLTITHFSSLLSLYLSFLPTQDSNLTVITKCNTNPYLLVKNMSKK